MKITKGSGKLNIYQRIILVAGVLSLIFFTIIQPPGSKTMWVDNPNAGQYDPKRVIREVPEAETIVRYDLVIILSTAVLFFAAKSGKQKPETRKGQEDG